LILPTRIRISIDYRKCSWVHLMENWCGNCEFASRYGSRICFDFSRWAVGKTAVSVWKTWQEFLNPSYSFGAKTSMNSIIQLYIQFLIQNYRIKTEQINACTYGSFCFTYETRGLEIPIKFSYPVLYRRREQKTFVLH